MGNSGNKDEKKNLNKGVSKPNMPNKPQIPVKPADKNRDNNPPKQK